MATIGRREQEILTAIVETYISTGEPVGSRTLARRNSEGLSAATIRNVMADLAEAGLLAQPHTSSGRVPSVEGYRYYAEKLSDQVSLKPDDEQTIQRYFQGVNEVQDFMERTSHVLSLISSGWVWRSPRPARARHWSMFTFSGWRSSGTGHCGYAEWRSSRPGAASSARCESVRTRLGGALHQ